MTLFEFEELVCYWAEHPPLHLLVGAYLGVGKAHRKQAPPSAPLPPARNTADLAPVLSELGPGFGIGDVHAGLAPVVLDFPELQHRETGCSGSPCPDIRGERASPLKEDHGRY